jgi:hypothetical protein
MDINIPNKNGYKATAENKVAETNVPTTSYSYFSTTNSDGFSKQSIPSACFSTFAPYA